MTHRESLEGAQLRWQKLEMVQDAYPTFIPFLRDMMTELGFATSEMQEDIGLFLEVGPLYRMIQAQRGQAKTTITAIYAVWRLIHAPKARILILSAGEKRAKEISTLIINLIKTVAILEPLRPDRSAGDRSSVEEFDVHHSLKGIDKSPSVACIGITGNLQGARADVLIADDVESYKNSNTAKMRENLLTITRDFTSINSEGDIIYLGTPQSTDSIYNTLPARGYVVRIWPGRYPSPAMRMHYGESLAPYIAKRLDADPSLATGGGLDGLQGQAIDFRLNEETLQKKELDQGPAYFQLQHMLLTALMDAMRYPLKPLALIAMRLMGDSFPMKVLRGFGGVQTKMLTVGTNQYQVSLPHEVSAETGKVHGDCLYIDPAAGGLNADETAWAHGQLLNSTIYLRGVGGIPGGYDLPKMEELAKIVLERKPGVVKIEKNMGHGAFRVVFAPVLKRIFDEAGAGDKCPIIEDDLVTGQKELRILGVLEPIMGRGSLVIDEALAEEENISLARYPAQIRNTYSFFWQLSRVTRDRNSLIHDDRLDAVAGMCQHFLAGLVVEQNAAIAAADKQAVLDFMKNPMGYSRSVLQTPQRQGLMSRLTRRL